MGSAAGCNRPWLFCAVVLFAVLIVVVAMAVNALPTVVSEENLPSARISSHVLDVANGKPAQAVRLTSFKYSQSTDKWVDLRETETNAEGRVGTVHPGLNLDIGTYKIRFDTQDYFQKLNQSTFFPFVEVVFSITDPTQHYHVPITLSNYGYSTYKGA